MGASASSTCHWLVYVESTAGPLGRWCRPWHLPAPVTPAPTFWEVGGRPPHVLHRSSTLACPRTDGGRCTHELHRRRVPAVVSVHVLVLAPAGPECDHQLDGQEHRGVWAPAAQREGAPGLDEGGPGLCQRASPHLCNRAARRPAQVGSCSSSHSTACISLLQEEALRRLLTEASLRPWRTMACAQRASLSLVAWACRPAAFVGGGVPVAAWYAVTLHQSAGRRSLHGLRPLHPSWSVPALPKSQQKYPS
jgi:hypothetical protein